MSATPDAPVDAVDEPLEVHGHPAEDVHGTVVVHVDAGGYLKLVEALHREGFTYFIDLTAVDQLVNDGRRVAPGVQPERFEVVVTLRDLRQRRRARVRCQVPEASAELPTLFPLYPGSEAFEREVYDLMGITFAGHPDLTRILLPDEWEGHPLRKDHPQGKVPIQFKAPSGGDDRPGSMR